MKPGNRFFGTLYIALICFLLLNTGAEGAQWVVTKRTDDGSAGTLRHAVQNAAAGDTVVFDPSIATVELIDDILLDKALTITGPATIKQTGSGKRVLYVTGDSTLKNLTITGGNIDNRGAGIFNYADLRMENCVVTGNTVGAGIYNLKNLTMVDCTVSNNTSTSQAWHAGGIINASTSYNSPVLTMHNCLVEGNSNTVSYGGGIFNGHILSMYGTTVRNNSSSGSGGGIYLKVFSDTTLAQSCVVTGNSPDQIVGPGQYGTLSVDSTCTVGAAPGNKSLALSGAAEGSSPEPRKTTGEADVKAVENDLKNSGSDLFKSVKGYLEADLGGLPGDASASLASIAAALYNAFAYEDVPLADTSGNGELIVEFTASYPENARYYSAFANYGDAENAQSIAGYSVPERGVQFESKPGQALPDGVTPPDFYEEGEGLMTWRNVIADNGPYDHNRAVGVVTFRATSIRAEARTASSGGSGCSTAAASPFALALGVPLLLLPRRNRRG
jgi:Synergist-CTERM protein sorting domain-containing protein